MPPKRPSGSFAVAETPMSEQRIQELSEIIRGVLSEQPQRKNWQFITAIALSPVLGALTFFLTQQLDFQRLKDKIAEHDRAIERIEKHDQDVESKAETYRSRVEDKLDYLTRLMTDKQRR